MNKKLFQTALLSSPIIALYGVAPFYIFNTVDIPLFISTLGALTAFVFSFWLINIFILRKRHNLNSWQSYLLSYSFAFIIQVTFIALGENIGKRPRIEINLFYPVLATFAINTIILIISNSIILQFQKQSADIEIQQLKVGNLEAQKQMLIQQLQPHFLFNALSVLKSLIRENPTNAEDYTVRLSQFLRYSVQAKNNDVVSLVDELKFTQDYIELQKVRFGDSFNCQIDIPQTNLSKKVPVYALQTLVENAIKHNAFTEKKALSIAISVEGNRIKVSNNVLPKAIHLPSGTGLQNLNQRYQMIADTDIEIVKTETNFAVLISLL
jgi:two-component system, LytTR family, sensor kinase